MTVEVAQDVVMTDAVPEQSSVDDHEFAQMLKIFYQRLFPINEMHRWLSYGDANYFSKREFSFTLASDAYIRFQSYANAQEFKTDLLRLNPYKIDLGAVYNIKPKDKKMFTAAKFQPLERELVFDIDMTDYDEIRTCCSGGNVCRKCWEFMTVAIKVIDRVLREDFGFKNLLWIYSGRRGVHCWIADERARKLTMEQRKAIVGYLEVVKGGKETTRKINLMAGSTKLHPSLQKAQKILDAHFTRCLLKNQEILSTPEQWQKVLNLIPHQLARKNLEEYFEKNKDMPSTQKWGVLLAEVDDHAKKNATMATAIRDIVFQYTYPRLDDHVSIGVNHLLKSPFCVHPKTGRVCVPIDPKKCDSFDPLAVPTLSQLMKELESLAPVKSEDGEEREVEDYMQTSLKPYMLMLKSFLKDIEMTVRMENRRKQQDEDRKMMF